jgi:hypothetical protein
VLVGFRQVLVQVGGKPDFACGDTLEVAQQNDTVAGELMQIEGVARMSADLLNAGRRKLWLSEQRKLRLMCRSFYRHLPSPNRWRPVSSGGSVVGAACGASARSISAAVRS